jgi:hypothetical protein
LRNAFQQPTAITRFESTEVATKSIGCVLANVARESGDSTARSIAQREVNHGRRPRGKAARVDAVTVAGTTLRALELDEAAITVPQLLRSCTMSARVHHDDDAPISGHHDETARVSPPGASPWRRS